MYRYFTYKNTRRYVDALDDMLHSYNNTRHSSISMTPTEVDVENEDLVRKRLYPSKPKSYTTKLVETMELEGAWEVGLLEIASPSSIENVSEDQCYYTIYFKPGNTSTIVRVPAGLYKRGNLLVDALHDAQRKQLRKIGVMADGDLQTSLCQQNGYESRTER